MYDLSEGLSRLDVPATVWGQIEYQPTPHGRLGGMIPEYHRQPSQRSCLILSSGEQAYTDYLLACAAFGTLMYPESYHDLGFVERSEQIQAYTIRAGMKKLIDLERMFPQLGYDQVLSDRINRTLKYKPENYSTTPWKNAIQRVIYPIFCDNSALVIDDIIQERFERSKVRR